MRKSVEPGAVHFKSQSNRFWHDCDACKFLGQFEEYDLYWCINPSHRPLDSLLFRFGNEGCEYLSSHPPFSNGAMDGMMTDGKHLYYLEMLKRGEEAGLYVCEKPISKAAK